MHKFNITMISGTKLSGTIRQPKKFVKEILSPLQNSHLVRECEIKPSKKK